jgi:hypothetical protein
MSRIYVIGDRETGILMVKSNPVSVVSIPNSAIAEYAESEHTSVADIFSRLAVAGSKIARGYESNPVLPDSADIHAAVGMSVLLGQKVSDAEFCFVADIDDEKFDSGRFIVDPMQDALELLASADGSSRGGFAEARLSH